MHLLSTGPFPNYLEWIQTNGDPSAQRLLFGFLPAYPMFMFAGILLVIVLAIISLKKKGIPLRDFEIGLIITVPLGILGGSTLGKLFIPHIIWYHVFFFWEPGMSLFGALFFGASASLAWFGYRSQKTQISLWVYADCIVPNLLLGQMLGRWGNFYNHEILGSVTSYESLQWLPAFIRDRLFYFPNLTGFELVDHWWEVDKLNEALRVVAHTGPFEGLTLHEVLTRIVNPNDPATWINNLDPRVIPYGTILYHEPLFLIEGIGNLALWLVIRFLVPASIQCFSRPKPWVLEPKAYPGRFNKTFSSLAAHDLQTHDTQLPIRYYHPRKSPQELSLSRRQAWNKAYYWYLPDHMATARLEEQQVKAKNQQLKEHKQVLARNPRFSARVEVTWQALISGNPIGRELERVHNPHHYHVLRCGTTTSLYLIGYLTLRIALETQRTSAELMVPHHRVATFILLSLILILGFVLLIMAQWIAPYRYREIGWLYEKSY